MSLRKCEPSGPLSLTVSRMELGLLRFRLRMVLMVERWFQNCFVQAPWPTNYPLMLSILIFNYIPHQA